MIKKSKLLTYVSEGLAALALAGTVFATPVHATFQKTQETLEERVVKKQGVGNLAVLLIDMQEWFLNSIEYEERHREIPYQLEVLEYCKNNSIPVFVLEYKDCGPTVKILKDKVDSLEKKVYITKNFDDGFVKTDLAKQLRKNNIDTVLVMGINASACVLSTASGAIMAGFKVMTSDDLIADPRSYGYNESIEWYIENGIYKDDYKDLLELISKEKDQITCYLLK